MTLRPSRSPSRRAAARSASVRWNGRAAAGRATLAIRRRRSRPRMSGPPCPARATRRAPPRSTRARRRSPRYPGPREQEPRPQCPRRCPRSPPTRGAPRPRRAATLPPASAPSRANASRIPLATSPAAAASATSDRASPTCNRPDFSPVRRVVAAARRCRHPAMSHARAFIRR